MMAGADMIHVPFRGGAPAMTALLSGQVQAYFVVASTSCSRASKLACAHWQ